MRHRKSYMQLPLNADLEERAHVLRRSGNLSEVLLWMQLRHQAFRGYHFERQKTIGDYTIDFYCPDCGVVVEIDKSLHHDKMAYDEKRKAFLEGLGLTVMPVHAEDVLTNLHGVMDKLNHHLALRAPLPGGEFG